MCIDEQQDVCATLQIGKVLEASATRHNKEQICQDTVVLYKQIAESGQRRVTITIITFFLANLTTCSSTSSAHTVSDCLYSASTCVRLLHYCNADSTLYSVMFQSCISVC
jgi:hypothetical protein